MRVPDRLARALSLGGLTPLILILGCYPTPPAGKHPVHPVEGRVLFGGKPVAGAQVSLQPVDESRFGDSIPRPTGLTDDDGHFKLMTYATDDGAPDGSYLVSINGLSRPRSEAGNLLESTKDAGKPDVLQGRFLDPKTSGLKTTVKPGEKTLEPFDLTGSTGSASAASPNRD